MIDVTNSIKKAYDESTTQYDKIILNNQEYFISNAQYVDDCYLDGNIFGTAIARTLEFEIENIVDLEEKEFEYLTGIKTENGIEWIDLGTFITQEADPNDTTGITKVTAMDYMLKSNIEYVSELNYSSGAVTMLQVLQEACQKAGITLATTDFANASFIVDSNQFSEGSLIRQVFQAVAQMSGTFAKIRYDNKLYLITPKRNGLKVKDVHKMKVKDLNKLPVNKLVSCNNKIKMNDYSELILQRNTHPINLVSLGMSDVEGENVVKKDEESIAEDGENSLVINNNPFAYTEEKRKQLITALFNTVKGFEYTSFEITGQAKPYQETGDEIVIINKDGTFSYSFLFRFNYKSPNGLESEMSAPSIIKATVAYQNVESAEQIAKRTELRVDKQEQTITGIIEQQTEQGQKLTEVKQTVDGITQTVSSVETKVEQVEDKAEQAQSTADSATQKAETAQNTADNINNNLTQNYYTKTQTNSQIQQTADSINQTIQQTIEKTNAIEGDLEEQSSKITEISASLEGIQQTVQDIENVTETAEGSKTVTLEECVEGDLLELHIYGNNTVFDYLYPSDGLYPSDDLYPYGDSRLVVTDKEGNSKTYELGVIDVLRQNGDVCDEYVLQDGKAKVIRRINKDGTVKTQETIEEIGEYAIHIKEGTNILTIKNYTAKITAKYAIKNDYTEIFATKVEMNSSITQTAEEINSEVSKKVGQDEFGTLISQNAYNVKIAWNNNTKCVQFEGNGITLYNGEVSENAKRAIFDFNGNQFYKDGYFIGAIRTNQWNKDNTHKGLVFDLNAQGKYMAWTERSDEENTFYTKLCYSRANSIYTEEGLHLGCDLYGHWFTLNNFHIGEISAGGYTGFTGAIPIVTEIVTDNGEYSYHYHSLLQVRNGIIVGYWED